jgi:hypothetical protein
MGGTPPEDEFGLLGTAIDGKYVVESVVAAGGFGVVYRGRHAVLGSPVALKVLKVPPDMRESVRAAFVQMFLNEARIVASLTHPAVVRAMDFGAVEYAAGLAAPWMALDWIDGATLAHDLEARRGRGGRSPAEALALLTPVLEALAEAHEASVVHRDLKPGNVMLPSARGRRGAVEARLLDFGIAKVMGGDDTTTSGQTQTHSALPAYSPRYASPEQVSRMRTGPWTDVHASGLLLTELLVDRAPYEGDQLRLTAQAMAATRPTPARFGVDVGPWEAILARAMALHPSDRYAHAGELLSALEATVTEAERARAAQASSALLLDEPTLTRTLPAAAPSAPAPIGGGTISAVVLPEAPPAPRGKGRRVVVALALGAAAALVGATAFKLGRAPEGTPRVGGGAQALVAAPPAAAQTAVAQTAVAQTAVAQTTVAQPTVVQTVTTEDAAAPPVPIAPAVRVAPPRVRPTRRPVATTRPPTLLPEPPPSAADERPPLE